MRAVVAVVPLLLVASCGGGGASKAHYVDQAEAVCAKANHEFDALTAPGDGAALVAYVQQLVGIADRATADLGKLQPPDKDKQAVQAKMMQPLQAQVAIGRTFVTQVSTAVQRHDQKALGRLVADPPTGTKADLRWMRSYGFRQCVTMADTGSR